MKLTKRFLLLVALPFIGLSLAQSSTLYAAPDGPKALLSGVYFHGYLKGRPNPDIAVRIANPDPKRALSLDGLALSDRFTPKKVRKRKGRGNSLDGGGLDGGGAYYDNTLYFPEGYTLKPGEEIWIAHQGSAFLQVFGFKPHFEGEDTDPEVPDMRGTQPFFPLNEGYGTMALLGKNQDVLDFVAWQHPKQDNFPLGSLSRAPWKGPPIDTKKDTPYGWTGRILGRARNEQGQLLPDSDSADDWPVGFSQTPLGTWPVHRVERPGQSHFIARPLKNVFAKVLVTSSPDNNHATFIKALDGAKKSLKVSVYQLTSPSITDALIRAKKRGLEVLVYLEGVPVGGLPDQERYLTEKLNQAKIPVHFLGVEKGSPIRPRFRYDHSKYVILDDRVAIIGTENYGNTGISPEPSFGNRGWMVHIEEPSLVAHLKEVWEADYQPGVMPDITDINKSPDDAYGMPYRDPDFKPYFTARKGSYEKPVPPLQVNDKMDLELVLSPDTSLNENSAIIGMMKRAKSSIIIQQNSVPPFWGKKKDKDGDLYTAETRRAPLPLQAAIQAAKRGVKVRVLIDGTWYNTELQDTRDNDDTVAYLNMLRESQGLDISAKVINLHSSSLEKIHAKGVIVDGKEVFVGSINWSENSFLGNREVGVILSHPKIAQYYAGLFERDWSQSLLYEAVVKTESPIYERPSELSKKVGVAKKSERVKVTHELPEKKQETAFGQVALGLGKTGYLPLAKLGDIHISPHEAAFVIGREVIATGKVVEIQEGKNVTNLKLARIDRPPLTVTVFNKGEEALEDAGIELEDFLHKEIQVKGKVTVYRSPQIIINHPSQLLNKP